MSRPPTETLIKMYMDWKNERFYFVNDIRFSRPSTWILVRSSGAATPTAKGLLETGSPPKVTVITISPWIGTAKQNDDARRQILKDVQYAHSLNCF